MQNYRGQNFRGRYKGNYIEMMTLEEAKVGLEIDNIPVISEGMNEAVVVDKDQVQGLVLILIKLGALNAGSMMISLKTVQTQIQRKSRTNTIYV